ncbi:MAG: hypothetical protein ICV83_00995 [Cytophagales bacterium]|nr:hypothetical protein [Cytophagales bacterium]
MTTPSGEAFYFEEKSEIKTTASSMSMFGNSAGPADNLSSRIWLLTKIVTRNKEEIGFGYKRTAVYKSYPSFSDKMQKLKHEPGSSYSSGVDSKEKGFFGTILVNNEIHTSSSHSKESYAYLSWITFPDGRIDFNTTAREDMDGAEKLESMRVSSTRLVKSYTFNYGYFDATAIGGNGFGMTDANLTGKLGSLRLKLLSVQDNAGAVHTFTYNENPLPKKNSYAQDLWGYYNGQLTNTSLVPSPAKFKRPELGDNGNNKSAHPYYAKAGILEAIQYPTGGKVLFEYELNEFSNYFVPDFETNTNTVSKGHGLRIRSVSFIEGEYAKSKKVNYSYSGGKAILPLQLFKGYRINHLGWPSSSGVMAVNVYTVDEASCSGYFSSSLFGSINGVGYDKVIKEEVDLAGKAKGRIETTFYNTPDEVIHSAAAGSQVSTSLPAIKKPNVTDNGLVNTIKLYNDQNQPLKEVSHNYTNVASAIYYGARIFGYTAYSYSSCLMGSATCERISAAQNLIGYYPIYDFQSLLSTQVTQEYVNNNTLTTTKLYTYDAYNQVKLETTTTPSVKEEIAYTFPYDKNWVPVNSALTSSNRLTEVIFTEKSRRDDPLATTALTKVYEAVKDFKQVGNKIVESEVSITEQASAFRNPYVTVFDVHDEATGKVLQYTNKNLISSLIWDYKGQYIVAEIKNAPQASVAYTSFEADGKGNWTLGGLPAADVTAPTGNKVYSLAGGSITRSSLGTAATYKVTYWSKGGPQTVNSAPAVPGVTLNGWTYYEHQVASPTGGTITVSGSGTIDELRLYPEGAQMTTYTFTPLVGMSSQCDPANQITYYEYDEAARLILVRKQDRDIVKKICYNYNGQAANCAVFYNAAASQSFSRNNCPAGYASSSVTYQVPAGAYSASTQEQADLLAQSDLQANGQQYANARGTCTEIRYYSAAKSAYFTRNNCDLASGQIAGRVLYTVADRAYSSTESQADADAMAQADININGQGYANTNGLCVSKPSIISAGPSSPGSRSLSIVTSSLPNCSTRILRYVDKADNGITGSSTGGCTNPGGMTVPATGRTYLITATLYSDAYPNGITSDAKEVTVPNPVVWYYNVAKSAYFTRNNCDLVSGQIGGRVLYTVAANTYSSDISQADADAKAQAYLNANGQNYANANGSCVSKPTVVSAGPTTTGGRTLSVITSGLNNCTSRVLSYVAKTDNGINGSNGGGCGNPGTLTVPYNNRTYLVKVTLYSDAYPNGITSDAKEVFVP